MMDNIKILQANVERIGSANCRHNRLESSFIWALFKNTTAAVTFPFVVVMSEFPQLSKCFPMTPVLEY